MYISLSPSLSIEQRYNSQFLNQQSDNKRGEENEEKLMKLTKAEKKKQGNEGIRLMIVDKRR